MYVRRGKLDVQLRVPCRRDVIFSCCNSSLARENREPPPSSSCRALESSGGCMCRARAPSFSRSRGEDGKIDDEHVCICRKQKSDEQLAKPVSYIFHVPICASVCITRVRWCPSKEFCHSKEKWFYSIFSHSLFLFCKQNHLFLLYETIKALFHQTTLCIDSYQSLK